ncbi:MAG: ATP-binding cassette domain-containing protein [Thermofilum sp.]
MIEARSLVKAYGGVPVLRGVSVFARRGEVTCIVGPNGSGKTTLLRILALLEKPDSGEVLYDGVVPASSEQVARVKAKTAYVPQRAHALSMSVYSNVYLALRSRGVPPQEASRRAEEALKVFGLYEARRKSALSLSGGQRQLLSVARALALQPEYMLLDEPTSNLDSERAALVLKLLKSFAREEGAAVILVTHRVAEAREIAYRTFILMSGRVVAALDGAPEGEELEKWLGG